MRQNGDAIGMSRKKQRDSRTAEKENTPQRIKNAAIIGTFDDALGIEKEICA